MKNVEGEGELIGDFVAGDLDGLMDGSGEDDFGAVGGFAGRAFDDDPQLAVGKVALDGGVFDFGIGVGGENRRSEDGEKERESARFHKRFGSEREKAQRRAGLPAGRICRGKV